MIFLVREGGLEPPQAYAHWILNPARLPIPPLPRGEMEGAAGFEPTTSGSGGQRSIHLSYAPSNHILTKILKPGVKVSTFILRG